MDEHLGGREPYFEGQINAYKVVWLIMAIFHEVRHYTNNKEILLNIRKKIGESFLIQECKFQTLPFHAKGYLLLVKLHCYRLVILLSRNNLLMRKKGGALRPEYCE